MTERYSADEIDITLDLIAAENASHDNDLVAVLGIQILGDTDAVNDTRAGILENYDHDLLLKEIRDDYFLDAFGVELAVALAKRRITKQLNKRSS
ncbi:MAG: hypothetical protein QFB86_01140 [Patescibacteria group bacterium]|nr:hypothetical protein [Patescibacteria group bacterium]